MLAVPMVLFTDVPVLGKLMATLGSASPWFETSGTLTASEGSLVAATCGNWYDLQKAQPLFITLSR